MTDQERAVMQQALEALEYDGLLKKRQAITALRAALAQEQPEHDPALSAALGWPGGISDPVLDRKTLLQQVAALAQKQQPEPTQEPVAWAFKHSDGTYHDPSVTEHSAGMVPLGPIRAQRPPLTDEEIRAHADKHLRYQPQSYEASGVFDLARAVERKVRGE